MFEAVGLPDFVVYIWGGGLSLWIVIVVGLLFRSFLQCLTGTGEASRPRRKKLRHRGRNGESESFPMVKVATLFQPTAVQMQRIEDLHVDRKAFVIGKMYAINNRIASYKASLKLDTNGVPTATGRRTKAVTCRLVTDKATAIHKSMFEQEMHLMANMQPHINIIACLGVHVASGTVASTINIIEYLPRGNLRDLMRGMRTDRSKRMPWSDLFTLMLQVADGMEFLSGDQHIVHRNLALTHVAVGATTFAKVGGFLCARRMEMERGSGDSTGTQWRYRHIDGADVINFKWAAPEVLTQHVFGAASDVWSFGMCLWELGTLGGSPYPNCTPEETVDRVAEGFTMPRSPFLSHTPLQLHQTIVRCWEESPAERPSFAQLRDELQTNQEAMKRAAQELQMPSTVVKTGDPYDNMRLAAVLAYIEENVQRPDVSQRPLPEVPSASENPNANRPLPDIPPPEASSTYAEGRGLMLPDAEDSDFHATMNSKNATQSNTRRRSLEQGYAGASMPPDNTPEVGQTLVSVGSNGPPVSQPSSIRDRHILHDSDYESPEEDEKDDYETPLALVVRNANVRHNQSRRGGDVAGNADPTLARIRPDPSAPRPPPRPSMGGMLESDRPTAEMVARWKADGERQETDFGRGGRDPMAEETGKEPLMPLSDAGKRPGVAGRKKRATGAKAMAAMAGAFAAANNGQKKRGRRQRRNDRGATDGADSDGAKHMQNTKFVAGASFGADSNTRPLPGNHSSNVLGSGRAQTGVVGTAAAVSGGGGGNSTGESTHSNTTGTPSGEDHGLSRIRWDKIAPDDITIVEDSVSSGAVEAGGSSSVAREGMHHTYVNDTDCVGSENPGATDQPGAPSSGGHSYVNDAAYVVDGQRVKTEAMLDDGSRHSYVNDAMFAASQGENVSDNGGAIGGSASPARQGVSSEEREYVNVSRMRDPDDRSPVGLEYLQRQVDDTERGTVGTTQSMAEDHAGATSDTGTSGVFAPYVNLATPTSASKMSTGEASMSYLSIEDNDGDGEDDGAQEISRQATTKSTKSARNAVPPPAYVFTPSFNNRDSVVDVSAAEIQRLASLSSQDEPVAIKEEEESSDRVHPDVQSDAEADTPAATAEPEVSDRGSPGTSTAESESTARPDAAEGLRPVPHAAAPVEAPSEESTPATVAEEPTGAVDREPPATPAPGAAAAPDAPDTTDTPLVAPDHPASDTANSDSDTGAAEPGDDANDDTGTDPHGTGDDDATDALPLPGGAGDGPALLPLTVSHVDEEVEGLDPGSVDTATLPLPTDAAQPVEEEAVDAVPGCITDDSVSCDGATVRDRGLVGPDCGAADTLRDVADAPTETSDTPQSACSDTARRHSGIDAVQGSAVTAPTTGGDDGAVADTLRLQDLSTDEIVAAIALRANADVASDKERNAVASSAPQENHRATQRMESAEDVMGDAAHAE
eukprot:m.893315 g.893315  ORF g.893315 m.893315 type:complete len:1435 (-) comp23659_c2_seq1:427-4731(-)